MVSTTHTTPHEIVRVDLADGRDYPIYIGSSFSDDETSSMLRRHIGGKRVLIITNDRIAPMYLEKYTKLLSGGGVQVDTVVLPDGEENKTYECMSMVLDRALELGLDRKSTFVALGGGVIGDMVGFASAIYQRGVHFIQVRLLIWSTLFPYAAAVTNPRYPFNNRSQPQLWQWWTLP